jgi:Flp pilus assembly protein TadD
MLARPLLAIGLLLVPSAVSFCLISTGSAGEPRPGQASAPLPLAHHSPPAADSPEAHVGKGYEYIKDERYQEAAKEFQAALALNPALPRARYQLAICYFALGQRREARGEFERLRQETAGGSGVAYYLGRLDLLDGDPESAIRRLQSVVAEPPFPDTAYYLGSAYREKGDLKSAETWLRKAAEMEPRDFRIYDHLARVYQKAGRRQEAEQAYARSSELREYYNEATHQAVDCSNELETQPLEKARLACEKLFQPDDPDKLTTLGMLYGQHGKYAEALPPLERAAKIDPDSSEIQHNLGLTYFRLRRYAAARDPLEKAVALRPDFFGSNALLGATLYTLGDDEAAYRVLDHAHQLNPQDLDTVSLLFKVATLLGQKTYAKKQYAPCLGYLKKAAALQPADADVHRRLAELYTLLGQRAQAEFESREAVRLSNP